MAGKDFVGNFRVMPGPPTVLQVPGRDPLRTRGGNGVIAEPAEIFRGGAAGDAGDSDVDFVPLFRMLRWKMGVSE